MQYVILTAFGVGGATIIGALIGFLVGKIPPKWNSIILGFAAGIMLAAAVFGLILPSMEATGTAKIWITVVGIMCGALFLNFADRFTPHLHNLTGIEHEEHNNNASMDKVLLFVMAIAIHNFPEGIAAGVAFGTGDMGSAVSVALGIALQNIPEGMVIISPLIMSGVSKPRTLLIASLTGVVEILGTFIGYFAASLSSVMLPFLLAFAGGTMLYVISDEMIPETHTDESANGATYSLLIGFCVMLVSSALIS